MIIIEYVIGEEKYVLEKGDYIVTLNFFQPRMEEIYDYIKLVYKY